jgi:anti-sigma-K factor RskA
MNTPPEDHDLIRWLDDEMTNAERTAFESRLDADPKLKAEAEEMRQLSQSLRNHVPREMPVPHADFFNSQIQVRISQLEMDEQRAAARRGASSSWLGGFWMRLLIPAAALVMVGMGWLALHTPPAAGSVVVSIYTPDSRVQAATVENVEAQATVLLLEGLDAMPADQNVAGLSVHHAETDSALATTTLFGKDGQVLLVMGKDPHNQPLMFTHGNPRG